MQYCTILLGRFCNRSSRKELQSNQDLIGKNEDKNIGYERNSLIKETNGYAYMV